MFNPFFWLIFYGWMNSFLFHGGPYLGPTANQTVTVQRTYATPHPSVQNPAQQMR